MALDDVIKTIISEAAGEGEEGMYAVASVISNRAKRRKLTPQQVVNQPQQFTGRWRKDLDAFIAKQPPAVIEQAKRAWKKAQTESIPGIDHYLTNDLYKSNKRPSWANKMGVVKTLGAHTFLDSTQTQKSIYEDTNNPPTAITGGTNFTKPNFQKPVPKPGAKLMPDEDVERKLFRMDKIVRTVFGTELSPLELRKAAEGMKQQKPKPAEFPTPEMLGQGGFNGQN